MKLIAKIKNRLSAEKLWYKEFKQFKKEYKRISGKKIIIAGVQRHGNIGDQAILCGERDFLADVSDCYYIEVSSLAMTLHPKFYKNVVDKRDLVLINGGGFLGTLWMGEENMCRNVIKTFKDNKIIIMPQTMYFEDSEWGNKERKISKEIYDNHPQLTLCAREEKTFNMAKELFDNVKIMLIPDMVLYYKRDNKEFDRKGSLLCIRHDKEKVLSDDNEKKIYNSVKKYFTEEEIKSVDTVVEYGINKEDARNEVNKKIDEFAQSKLIITDRLHGMVLATIAETPCIALGNCSGKVRGVYEWIKDLDYIEYIEDLDYLDEAIKKVMNSKNKKYNNEGIKNYYKELIEAINE